MRPVNLWTALTVLAIAFGGCLDGEDLRETDTSPVPQPPDIHGKPSDGGAPAATMDWQQVPAARPVIGDVELRQSRLDTNPAMGTCPVFGVGAEAWVLTFSQAIPLDQPTEVNAGKCRLIPPNSTYPNLSDSAHTYPNNALMNDNIRTLSTWAAAGKCVRVTLKEHPDWWMGGGTALVYLKCNGSLVINVPADGGAGYAVTQVRVDWFNQ
jgi:hypothetical protein